ncbi:MAG TPA: hypothetical protein PLE90_08145 [Dysgonamonadaceae bacterium]|nr:hypothetical protein [Dysgonamonadaceae bacterium]
MNSNSVEKLLRKKAAQLPEAEFKFNASPNQAEIIIPVRKGRAIRSAFRVAIATLAVVVLTFSVCFAASAEFRNTFIAAGEEFRKTVISLFRASEPEIVSPIPTGRSNTIQFIGRQNIDDIADVSYYNIDGDLSDNIAMVNQPDGSIKYYLITDNGATEITQIINHVTDTISFNGYTLHLKFGHGTLNGKPFLRDETGEYSAIDIPEDVIMSWPKGFFNENTVWIHAGFGRQADYTAYYLLYDLRTGEVTDILAGVIPEGKSIETISFSPDYQKLLLNEFNGGWPGECIYFDAATGKAISLSDLTGIDNIYLCSFVNDEVLFIEQYHNELRENMMAGDYILSGYCYNISTKETIKLFDENDTVLYASMGTCIFKENENYKIVTFNGEEYIVEGIDLDSRYLYLMNRDHTKIAIINDSADSNTFDIREIGIIDLVKKEIKIIERKGYEKIEGTTIGWNDSTSLFIYVPEGAIYLYRFK